MAAVTRTLFDNGDAAATFTYDDVTGAISALDASVAHGKLTAVVSQGGKPDIAFVITPDGAAGTLASPVHRSVPAGYTMTQVTAHGTTFWAWAGTQSFSFSYTPI